MCNEITLGQTSRAVQKGLALLKTVSGDTLTGADNVKSVAYGSISSIEDAFTSEEFTRVYSPEM